VADKPTWTKQTGVTPGKLALVGVLAVVLGGVLYIQFGPISQQASTSAPPPAMAAESTASPIDSNAAVDVALAPADAAPSKKTGAVASWQLPELASVVEYDPFALPASFPQPQNADEEAALAHNAVQTQDASVQQAALAAERTKSETELQGLRQQGVQVILRLDNKYAAIVGDKEVHVGDQIDGFTVIAIDADGVRVAKDLSP
jgi:hypothetical protein